MTRTRMLTAADLFCGAGGSTTGAEASGKMKVVLAVNHWRTAIYTHQDNHPHVRHICARIDDIDARNDDLPRFDVLLASPECTHHSIARGGAPIEDQKRATPWHVCAWAEARQPKWIIVENVREFRDWGPVSKGRPIKSRKGETFNAWINALRSLGYTVDWRLLNAADYGEATKRVRLFVVARKGSGKIPWPEPTHSPEKWKPAYTVIDWTRPCPSIFARKRPLAEKTLRRIEIGLRKFVGPFIVKLRGSRSDIGKAGDVHGVTDPLGTITAGGQHHGACVPFFLPRPGFHDAHKADKPEARDLSMSLPTIIASDGPGHIVLPFLVKYHGGTDPQRDGSERQHSVDAPLPTLDTQPRFALAAPYLIDVNHGEQSGDRSYAVDEPLRTVTTKRGQSLVLPFITKYHGTGGAQPIDEPLSTVTTKHRHGLALVQLVQTMEELGISDIGFRMLDVDELARAQGFPEGYKLHGTKAEQIKQVGNAVCPGVMRAICAAVAAV